MLKVENLVKSFPTPRRTLTVLTGVSFDVAAGETVALMGESGCGKSTLLHVIAGLEMADAGSINLQGAEITNLDEAGLAAMRRDKISIIFQQFNLITSLPVAHNLSFEAKLAGRHDPDWIAELVARLDLKDILNRYPEQLSGGQQQRVAIARSFAARPSLILADEPTGNLDEANSDRVLEIAFDLVARTGCGLLMATHSNRLASRADRVLYLSAGKLA